MDTFEAKKDIVRRYWWDQDNSPTREGFGGKLQVLQFILDYDNLDEEDLKQATRTMKWLLDKYAQIDFDQLDRNDPDFAILFKIKDLLPKLDAELTDYLTKVRAGNKDIDNASSAKKILSLIADEAKHFQFLAARLGVIKAKN